uniref:PilZ domain-containing protein n=1 Tax=Methylobacterium sp. B34 TaxID=95563 RepID=UPI00034C53E6|nr:PilZ domain-containing protein [Methylobacterium sp. B34]
MDRRSDARIVPRQRTVALTLLDGSSHVARIVDISRSGASLVVGASLRPGTRILVGRRYAHVVRTTDEGVAVAFELPLGET